MWKRTLTMVLTLVAAATFAGAQGTSRPASPGGSAETQLGKTGKWIGITYSRPIKRGRDVWGGPSYGKDVLLQDDAKVWRAGANVSTRSPPIASAIDAKS